MKTLRDVARLLIPVTLYCAACGGHAQAPADGPVDGPVDTTLVRSTGVTDAVALARVSGWPDAVAVRRVGGGHATHVTRAQIDGQGQIWLLRDQSATADFASSSPLLERYRPTGELDQQFAFQSGSRVPAFVLHPSGELTVLVIHAGSPTGARCDLGGDCTLAIIRLSATGEILTQRELQDPGKPGEAVAYDLSGQPSPIELPADQRPRFWYGDHVIAVPDGEGLYLVAWSIGAKLYRLAADGSERWSAQLMPRNLGMAFSLADEDIAVDEQGRVFVAYQIFQDDVAIYARHFRRPALAPAGAYDVLVQGFDDAGAFLGARLVGGAAIDAPAALAVHAGRATVIGSSRVTKYDPATSPNRTMEWDLLVARGDAVGDAPAAVQAIDVARDDFVRQAIPRPDGSWLVAGRTDYVQVDTNSEVENGKGLLMVLTPDLQPAARITLAGPRDVQVEKVVALPDGRAVFAGIRNGPLTHTPPAETTNEGMLGVLDALPP